jgi:3-hydroxy-5-methyl-1-naphthoate 3-O-methyltransferase
VSNPLFRLPILEAAVQLQVWAVIANGNRAAERIAAAAGADRDGMERLLNALVILKLLEKKGGEYSLPALAEYYLVPGKPAYMGEFILEWMDWEKHGRLAEAIRTGKRPLGADATGEAAARIFAPIYAARAVKPERYDAGCKRYWDTLQVEPAGDYRVLDLACGAGITTVMLAKQHAGMRVTLQDWPEMAAIALGVARELGVEDRMDLLPGDMRTIDFGVDLYNLVRLGSVTYFLGRDDMATIFQRAYRAMRKGGVIIIEAPLSDEERCQQERAVLDGPWLFAVTARGDVYSFTDYKAILEQAGFSEVTRIKDDFVKAFRK